MTNIPDEVAGDEPLHRRIHPKFQKDDGSISSQAFTDPEMSVDRSRYCELRHTMHGCDGYGVAELLASVARSHNQQVVPDKILLNPAHALVNGAKPKSIARKLARASMWILRIGEALPED